MFRTNAQYKVPITEPEAGRPASTGEQWLGRNRSAKRQLWERLNPRSKKQLRLIAEGLALHQTHARLPEPVREKLSVATADLERLAGRIGALLAEVARKTPPSA